jgi:predicted transcriptional regulator
MENLKGSSLNGGNTVLISIHPNYANLIVNGSKMVEFRRVWASRPVQLLAIYATTPVQQIVALAQIRRVTVAPRHKLWDLAKAIGGGISRKELFEYLNGKNTGVAIELKEVTPIIGGLDPAKLFGQQFRPPQSFRYLKEEEYAKLEKLMGLEHGHHFCGGDPRGGEDQLL